MQKQMYNLRNWEILAFLIKDSKKLDDMIILEPEKYDLFTTDLDIFQALASIEDYDDIKIPKFRKLFESVNVVSYKEKTGRDKPKLTQEDIEKIREMALRQE